MHEFLSTLLSPPTATFWVGLVGGWEPPQSPPTPFPSLPPTCTQSTVNQHFTGCHRLPALLALVVPTIAALPMLDGNTMTALRTLQCHITPSILIFKKAKRILQSKAAAAGLDPVLADSLLPV